MLNPEKEIHNYFASLFFASQPDPDDADLFIDECHKSNLINFLFIFLLIYTDRVNLK
jgi:hypothetical protein